MKDVLMKIADKKLDNHNYCTLSYSLVYVMWEEYEKLIDWILLLQSNTFDKMAGIFYQNIKRAFWKYQLFFGARSVRVE